jgi:hypothetical protein
MSAPCIFPRARRVLASCCTYLSWGLVRHVRKTLPLGYAQSTQCSDRVCESLGLLVSGEGNLQLVDFASWLGRVLLLLLSGALTSQRHVSTKPDPYLCRLCAATRT